MLQINIYNLTQDKKQECHGLSCSIETEQEGSICILPKHIELQGTLCKNSSIKIIENQSGENKEIKLDISGGMFDCKNNTISIFYEEI